MSISVKNISVAIAGTTSTAFDIELEGTRYHMDDFTLSQSLLTHNMLSFSMHKALPDEEINEPQFELCGYIIGKKITVSLKTVSIESESLNGGGDTIADIEFKGFINQDMRLDPVILHKDFDTKSVLLFYMGKNSIERRQFIMQNLRIEDDESIVVA